MRHQNRRSIIFLDLSPRMIPESAPAISLVEALIGLHNTDSSQLERGIRNDKASIFIIGSALDEQKKLITFLFGYSDQEASDPVFHNRETRGLRVAKKERKEGIAQSAHLIVSLEPDSRGMHLATLESVSRISRFMVESFLNNKFMETRVGVGQFRENNRLKKRTLKVNIYGHIGQKLKYDLTTGHLNAIELIQPIRSDEVMDENGILTMDTQLLALKPKRKTTGNIVIQSINSVIRKFQKTDYKQMRIRFTKPTGLTGLHTIDLSESDAGESQYLLKEDIQVASSLEECVKEIRQDVVEQMVERMVAFKRNLTGEQMHEPGCDENEKAIEAVGVSQDPA